MPERDRISTWQFFWVIVSIIITLSTFRLPHLILGAAKQDYWLAILIAIVMDISVGACLFLLGRRHPGRTLFEYAQELLGGLFGRLAGVAYVLLFLQMAVLLARSLSESLFLVMPETPGSVFVITIVFLAGLAVNKGLEVIGRLAELIGVILFFLASGVPLLASSRADFGNLLPVLQTSPAVIVKAGLLMTSFFGICVVMGVLMAYQTQPEMAFKVKAAAVVMSGFLMLASYGVALAIFGGQAFSAIIHVSFGVARLISIRGFVERVEAMVMALWVAGGFLAIAVLYYCAALGVAQILKRNSYQPVIPPLGVAMVALSLWQFKNRVTVDRFVLQVYLWYALAIEAGLTGILLVVSLLKASGKQTA